MEEEELAKRWERLNLSLEESSVFQVAYEGVKESGDRWKFYIIGEVLVDKELNNEAFRTTVSSLEVGGMGEIQRT